MTQKDKTLLLKDLSARLAFGVKVQYEDNTIDIRYIEPSCNKVYLEYPYSNYAVSIEDIKPYLRPMSSMTEKERYEFEEILGQDVEIADDFIRINDCSRKRFSFLELEALFVWLNAHRFDYNNLIEKCLAIAVTEENNPYK